MAVIADSSFIDDDLLKERAHELFLPKDSKRSLKLEGAGPLLPKDVIIYLLKFCQADTLLNISTTCSWLYNLTNDVDLWCKLCENYVHPNVFKNIYKVLCKLKYDGDTKSVIEDIIYQVGIIYDKEPIVFLDKLLQSFRVMNKDDLIIYTNKLLQSIKHFYYLIYKWHTWHKKCDNCSSDSLRLIKYCYYCSMDRTGGKFNNKSIDKSIDKPYGINFHWIFDIQMYDNTDLIMLSYYPERQERDLITNYILYTNKLGKLYNICKLCPDGSIIQLDKNEYEVAKSRYYIH